MGRQPFGLASPAAWLRDAGWTVTCADVSRETLDEEQIRRAEVFGFYLPMHTATRLALPIVARVRRVRPSARIAAYGLYAPPNAPALRAAGVDEVFGGEFEQALTEWANLDPDGKAGGNAGLKACTTDGAVPRLHFIQPDRTTLPPLERYATLQMPDGRRKLVGYTEASRGCRHLCRHCPVVPIYNGQFRVVPVKIVLADIDAQIAAGATHITFGDPDFFNGPTHALRVVDALHAAHPEVTYDVTVKIEHLLRHQAHLGRLRDTGCAFVTAAVESIDDAVLMRLEKGHTRADFAKAVSLCREASLPIAPTFVAFHPWTTLDGYCELVDTIEALDLVDHVAPIQLAIRLLVPEGSRLLELAEVRALVRGFDAATLTHRWLHPDARVDDLQREIAALVGVRGVGSRRALFDAISDLAHERAGRRRPGTKPARDRATVPYLNEPWYC
jgi:radical SAM superfamily enzyme YgiQ (UPF0313 family)